VSTTDVIAGIVATRHFFAHHIKDPSPFFSEQFHTLLEV
jgi:hypothetical protein